MALKPKLNIYLVTLNPKDKNSNPTYRDLFKDKFMDNTTTTDDTLLDNFFKTFLDMVGMSKFRKDMKSKKVIGVSEYNPNNYKTSLNIIHNRCVIEGLIDGGQYGILRAYADIDNKAEKTSLDTSKAVLDKFYICFCTPLNSAYGFLFVQSYTEVTIQEPVSSFITDLLRYEDKYFNIRIEPYIPKKFVEKFKKDAKIRMFSFRSKVGVKETLRDGQLIKGQMFDIEIIIKPREEAFYPGTEEGIAIAKELSSMKFQGTDLSEYNQKVYIQTNNGYKAHYDINREISSIRPTIYLQDECIDIDEKTGQPNFAQIKEFVLSLLDEVLREFNHENIDEL